MAENNNQISKTRTHFFLNKLVSMADRNAMRKSGGYRYDSDVQNFALYFRILAGPMAYETIQRNLPCAIPSLSSTNRYLQKSSCRIIEGILRSQELKLYLEERHLEKVVCISEDATRIVGRIQYNSRTNQVTGFVLPLSKKSGYPVPFSFPARNASEIIEYFDNNKPISSFVNVIMAQSVDIKKSSPFCLMIFGSDNKYTSTDVCNRWNFIKTELRKVGITAFIFSSDSDPRYNAAMRKLSLLGFQSNINHSSNWFSCGDIKKMLSNITSNVIETVYVQDTIHISTKLRNLLLKTINNETKLPFEKHYIQQSHLRQLITNYGKDKHNLTMSTLNPIDKQNFRSVQRICHEKVIDLLRKTVDSHATAQFLQLIQFITDSFLDVNLTPLQRIYKIWYSVFMLRLWREFISSKKINN